MGFYQREVIKYRSTLNVSRGPIVRSGVTSRLFPLYRPVSLLSIMVLCLVTLAVGCSSFGSHYQRVEKSLLAGHLEEADHIVEKTQEEYGQRSRLLYLMDRGMTLHLAGHFQKSNEFLEQADQLIEEFYTTRIRDEAAAILLNETQLPYQGDPYEQVMVNVIKALNYTQLQDLPAALVEARRIDHRLNLLADSVDDDAYHEDPFARYLTGLLYEATGDLNNAFIAYRKAEQGYRQAESWSHVTIPSMLKEDLLRTAKALGFDDELLRYQEEFPDMTPPVVNREQQAQIILVNLNGLGPRKSEALLDFPISLDALNLIALTKRGFGRSSPRTRGPDAVLYGLQGDIVRVALPQVLLQPSLVSYSEVRADNGVESYQTQTQRVYDIQAVAKKNLDDDYTALVVRAVARAAMKMAAAVGIGYGARAAVNKNSQAWVGLVAVILARIFAIATEEADIRTWRTLPGEIQVARLWVPPGTYSLVVHSFDARGQALPGGISEKISLLDGETKFLTQRIPE
ncbi:MAG: hypothetical protein MRJ96_14375 [Nitrospirales bacterium]|nr:hypothetical protein [Nitrospira sp.]MDR4502628.1 hypothetical protein [Nitrospirales bacterium]